MPSRFTYIGMWTGAPLCKVWAISFNIHTKSSGLIYTSVKSPQSNRKGGEICCTTAGTFHDRTVHRPILNHPVRRMCRKDRGNRYNYYTRNFPESSSVIRGRGLVLSATRPVASGESLSSGPPVFSAGACLTSMWNSQPLRCVTAIPTLYAGLSTTAHSSG